MEKKKKTLIAITLKEIAIISILVFRILFFFYQSIISNVLIIISTDFLFLLSLNKHFSVLQHSIYGPHSKGCWKDGPQLGRSITDSTSLRLLDRVHPTFRLCK